MKLVLSSKMLWTYEIIKRVNFINNIILLLLYIYLGYEFRIKILKNRVIHFLDSF